MSLTRRNVLVAGAAAASASLVRPALAAPATASLAPELLARARAALNQHSGQIANRDVIAIADFSQPSRQPRFHLVDVASGRVGSHLVAHGRGSDPGHTGWLEHFSNDQGSNATCAGAFRTDGFYVGAHGRSIRLSGLDTSNSNALGRGIVVHSAWYVSPDMARSHGVLGRSEGCFALSPASLEEVMARLGPGHMIYADKLSA
ncbi:MAG TPA: murein L,D-transpeptidase catalytic domain family protein [Rhizomicrobium sp.]|jgi:hypothetical protein